jgi:hypothetical protein
MVEVGLPTGPSREVIRLMANLLFVEDDEVRRR